MEIRLPNRWEPRPYQRPLWSYLSNGGRRAVARWHRRSGKDDVFLHHTACAAHERIGNYWYMLPEYAQARKSMWDAVNSHTGKRRIDEAFPPQIRSATREQEMMIVFGCGSTFQLVGSDNFNSLVGSPPVGLVFSEYALSNPSAWGYLRPILLENGGWAGFNSTPRGKNHFKAMCELAGREKGWFYECLTAEDTGVFTTFQLEAELRELQAEHGEDYGRSLWMQEYFCSFDAAIPGSIWGDCVEKAEASGRVLEFAVDHLAPVDTGWDLGRTDDTAIWFRQLLGRDINIIDHHSSNLKDIDFYVTLLLEKRKEHGITYGTHWLPHDARPRTLAAGGKSILQQFHDAAKLSPELGRFAIAPRLDRQEGIQAARKTFPYCRFHKTRCDKGLESLRHYHREWDAELRIFNDNPVHDWCLAPETEVLTRSGTQQIMNLSETGEVLTSCGWRRYIAPRITRKNAPLVGVSFTDGLTVRCTPDHLFLTAEGWRFAEHLTPDSPIQSFSTLSPNILTADFTAYGRANAISLGAVKNFIEMFGNWLSGIFLPETTFTTSMQIPRTIYYQILNAFRQTSIYPEPLLGTTNGEIFTSRKTLEIKPRNGTAQKRGDYGTAGTWSAFRRGPSGSAWKSLARTVLRCFSQSKERAVRIKDSAQPHAKFLRIASVSHLSETSDVWCITVPGVENYALANGALVHNSSHDADAWRTLSTTWKFRYPKPSEAPLVDRLQASSVTNLSFGDLRKQHFARKRAEREYA